MTFEEYFKEKYGGIAPYLELATRAIAEDAWNAAFASVQPVAVPDGAILKRLVRYDAVAVQNNGYDWGVEMRSADAGRFVEFDYLEALLAAPAAKGDAVKPSKQVCANCGGEGRFYKTVMSDFGSGEREETVCKVCVGSGVIYAAVAAKAT